MISYIGRDEFDRTINDLRALIPAFSMLSGSKGIIVGWSGNTADVPDGWHICEGNNGTPDLRNRFIRGAPANTAAGNTGGANQHTHENHAALAHTGANVAGHAGGQILEGSNATVLGFADVPDLAHNVTQPANHAAVSHANANNIPPYYELIFLMWAPSL